MSTTLKQGKYKIEIFESPDIVEETVEQSAEAMALIEEMGLTGQQALCKKNEETGVQTRFPYRLMTDEERFIYSVLCPEKTELKNYRNDAVPFEILKTAKMAMTFPETVYLSVWSASSKTVKDPVLVGSKNYWASEVYLLGRWGEELLPLEVLIPDAINRWYKQRQDNLRRIIDSAQRELSMPAPLTCPREFRVPELTGLGV